VKPQAHAGFELSLLGMSPPANTTDYYRIYHCPSKETVTRGLFKVERLRDCLLNRNFVYDKVIEEQLRKRYCPAEYSLSLSLALSLALALALALALSLSLSLSRARARALSLSLSHTHTHRFGPDELTMELEGPEVVWMQQHHHDVTMCMIM
jgi:hypothetical protein